MILVPSCSCLCPIHWSQVLSRQSRCSWSRSYRRCSSYIWVNHNSNTFGATYVVRLDGKYIRSVTLWCCPIEHDISNCTADIWVQHKYSYFLFGVNWVLYKAQHVDSLMHKRRKCVAKAPALNHPYMCELQVSVMALYVITKSSNSLSPECIDIGVFGDSVSTERCHFKFI